MQKFSIFRIFKSTKESKSGQTKNMEHLNYPTTKSKPQIHWIILPGLVKGISQVAPPPLTLAWRRNTAIFSPLIQLLPFFTHYALPHIILTLGSLDDFPYPFPSSFVVEFHHTAIIFPTFHQTTVTLPKVPPILPLPQTALHD